MKLEGKPQKSKALLNSELENKALKVILLGFEDDVMNRMLCKTINRRAYDSGKHRQMQEPLKRKIFVLKRIFFFFGFWMCSVSSVPVFFAYRARKTQSTWWVTARHRFPRLHSDRPPCHCDASVNYRSSVWMPVNKTLQWWPGGMQK